MIRRIFSLLLFLGLGLLLLPCQSKAQAFYVNYSWQYPNAPGQSLCSSEMDCHIQFNATNNEPCANVTGWTFAPGHVFFSDCNQDQGVATPVTATCTETDAQLTVTATPCANINAAAPSYHRWTLGPFSTSIYDKNGHLLGTMNETFTYVVQTYSSRWGWLHKALEANLQ